MRSANCKSRILLAVATVLLAVMICAAGYADSGLEITVWYGPDGGSNVLASSLSDTGTDYWVQLPGDSFGYNIGIVLNDQYGRYADWSADIGIVNGNNITIPGNTVNSAGSSVDGFPTLNITGLDAYGNPVTVYSLYISVSPVPQEQPVYPSSADIQVYYQAEDGTNLGSTTVSIAAGSGDNIYAQEFGGYQLISESSVYVTVDAYGNPSQPSVTFTYRALPQSADIQVYYQAENGTNLGSTTVSIAAGSGDNIYAQEFGGYQLISESSVYVTVDAYGNPSQSSVTFTYRALPQSADIQVYYQAEDGTNLGSTTVTIAAGSGDTIYAQEFGGYQLISESSVYVTVDAYGNPSQSSVTFTYRALPQSADIQVYYQAEDGTNLGSTTVTIAAGGGDTIYAQEFGGYQLISESSVYVTVDAYGNPSQSSVTFTYRALPQSADVQVYYQAEDGTSLGSTTVTIAAGGGDTIYAQEFGGYQLISESSVYVTVDAYGNPSQSSVTFTYRALPQNADIQVYYQAEDGTSLGSTTVTIAVGGGDTIYAQEINGYQLTSESSVYVTVDAYGNPSQSSVTFTYRALPQSADIQVYYQAEDGTNLGSTTVTIAAGSGDTVYAQEISGYQLISESSVYVTVDAYGNPSQSSVTFTYRALPQSADIQVYYQAEDGTNLGSTTVTIAAGGGDTVYAQEISGYQLIGESSVYVTVDAYGNPSQSSVTFTYRALPDTAELLILYVLSDGTEISRATRAIPRGESQTVTPEVPDGYQLVAGTETQYTVTVDELGNIDSAQVIFHVERIPQNGTVTVYHKTQDGNLIEQESFTVPSENTINVSAKTYDGYTIVEGQPGSVEVSCDRDGNVNPAEVTFTYRTLPGSVEVQILYLSADGTEIDRASRAIARGDTQVITPVIPDGYQLLAGTESQFTVTVDELGNIDTAQVIFYLETVPRDGSVTVFHKTQDGTVIEQESFTVPSENTITVSAKAFDGYTLDDGQPDSMEVYCDRNGYVNPSEVSFVYRALPGSVEVLILYTLPDGTEINRLTQAIARGESKTITPSIPDGYQLVAGTADQYQVTVDALGNIDTAQVVFTIERIPQDGTVSVFHKTQDGTVLEQENFTVASEGKVTVTAKTYDGYALDNSQASSVDVTCDRDGNVTPAEVTFLYRALPGSAAVNVIYVTADGMELSRQEVQIPRGDSRRFEAEPPTGYRLAESSPQSVTVTVNDMGVADTEEVRFIVELIPQNGTVTVYYCDLGGNFLAYHTVQVTGGQTVRITPDPAVVPAGYDPASAPAQTVQVSAAGVATPNRVYFNLAHLDNPAETPVPNVANTLVQRWAKTSDNNVKLRRSASRSSTELANIRNRNSDVWVIDMVQGNDGWIWDHVIYNGQEGYIRSDKLNIMKQGPSDDQQQTVTTPVPTVTPTPAPPVITPTPTPTAAVITPTPSAYRGFALSTVAQSLLSATTSSARGLQTIQQGDLLTVGGQVTSEGIVWSYVTTENGASGYVPDSTLRRISDAEAAEIRNRNITPAPVTPTPTPIPMYTGYFKPVGDNVPLRNQASDVSVILRLLSRETNGRKTVVYVSGQIYDTEDGWIWHVVYFDGVTGFIRSDMLAELSSSELQEYLSGTTPTPVPVSPTNTPSGIDYNAMSSYGYISNPNDRSVNIRKSPNGDRITTLYPYATCLVLGSQSVNGTTWYHIKYDNGSKNVDGWVMGESATSAGFFHQMTMAEFQAFVQSPQYQEGIRRNSSSNTTPKPNSTADIASIEEQNVQEWTDPNSGSNVNYTTWVPIPTTPPIDYTTPTPNLINPSANPYATDSIAQPTDSLPIATIPGSGIADLETEMPSGGIPSSNPSGDGTNTFGESENPPQVPWGLIIGGGLAVIGGAAGVGVYLHSQNKRNAAKRAAQRRAQAGSSAARQNPQPATYNTGRPSSSTPAGSNARSGRPVNPSASNPYQPKFSSTTQAQTPQNTGVYSAPVQGTTPQQASTSAYQRPVTQTNPVNPAGSGTVTGAAGTVPPTNLNKPTVGTPVSGPVNAPASTAPAPSATPPTPAYRSNAPAVPSGNPQTPNPSTESIRNRRAGQPGSSDSNIKPMT